MDQSIRQTKPTRKSGSSIRGVKGLRQSDIEGLAARQVGRIESGQRATLSALQELAQATPWVSMSTWIVSPDAWPRMDEGQTTAKCASQVPTLRGRRKYLTPSRFP